MIVIEFIIYTLTITYSMTEEVNSRNILGNILFKTFEIKYINIDQE